MIVGLSLGLVGREVLSLADKRALVVVLGFRGLERERDASATGHKLRMHNTLGIPMMIYQVV